MDDKIPLYAGGAESPRLPGGDSGESDGSAQPKLPGSIDLAASDFFGWYVGEIARYRDHEWQLVSYSVGLSSAVVLFARGAETRGLVGPWAAGIGVSVVVSLLIVAQYQTHKALNVNRKRLDLLREGGCHDDANLEGPLCNNRTDGFYFWAFVIVAAAFGIAAFLVLVGGTAPLAAPVPTFDGE